MIGGYITIYEGVYDDIILKLRGAHQDWAISASLLLSGYVPADQWPRITIRPKTTMRRIPCIPIRDIGWHWRTQANVMCKQQDWLFSKSFSVDIYQSDQWDRRHTAIHRPHTQGYTEDGTLVFSIKCFTFVQKHWQTWSFYPGTSEISRSWKKHMGNSWG